MAIFTNLIRKISTRQTNRTIDVITTSSLFFVQEIAQTITYTQTLIWKLIMLLRTIWMKILIQLPLSRQAAKLSNPYHRSPALVYTETEEEETMNTSFKLSKRLSFGEEIANWCHPCWCSCAHLTPISSTHSYEAHGFYQSIGVSLISRY